MVRVVGLVAPWPGVRVAPEPLPLPIVTTPAIVPGPARVPALACTGPVPVPEPVVLLITNPPALTVVPPV